MRDREIETIYYTALSCFTIGGRAFRKTLKPQIHLISGSRESSSTVTRVPQRMHSYATELSPDEASISFLAALFKRTPHFKLYQGMLVQPFVLLYGGLGCSKHCNGNSVRRRAYIIKTNVAAKLY